MKNKMWTYLGPADITGHVWAVQNSAMDPYNKLTWLKKSIPSINKYLSKHEYAMTENAIENHFGAKVCSGV